MSRTRKVLRPPQDPTGASMARGQSKQDYGTPRDFLDAVERRWGKIAFDLAAEAENAKASEPLPSVNPSPAFFSPEQDSLVQVWRSLHGTLWLNPPFGNIAPWAEKCAWEAQSENAPRFLRILFLVPASVGSEWYARHVHGKAMVYGLTGRLCFDGKNPYPKDCILAVYGEPPGFDLWKWRT